MPFATATAAPPRLIAAPLTAVMVRAGFSKLSLARTARVTGVSSGVLAASLAMSATGAMTIVLASVSVSGAPAPVLPPSFVVIVSVTVPLKSAGLWVKTGAAAEVR
ncbi:hypothetical protein OPKNFCMD_3555 [Methylobacterium crusticola]|uniref:Uncharacterized protein n=1 Tax=Methylobacterium crusticola TaxID=1697972 RepID=A0ABQ4R1R8_9HYPH|nr:hypothetical protein OPKNFCMD_3555 [Methylobacterium crusticola]